MSAPLKTYHLPGTVSEALALAEQDYQLIGGGTDAMIRRKQYLESRPHIIDLSQIGELRILDYAGGKLTIGAGVTLAALVRFDPIREHYPLIGQAARSIASPVIRQTATVGGNLLVDNRCTFYDQSKNWREAFGACLRDDGDICQVTGTGNKCFSRNVSDLAPALIVLAAELSIRHADDATTRPLIDIYTSDGIAPHQHLDGGIITALTINAKPAHTWFRKLRLRESVDFTSLTIAATVSDDKIARVCLGGVSMAPVVIEGSIIEQPLEYWIRQALKLSQTVDNDLMSIIYRRQMITVFLEDWWSDLEMQIEL